MTRPSKKVKELQAQIKALSPDEQAEVVRGVMTPLMQFSLTVERIWKKQGKQDVRAIRRAVRADRKEAEQEYEAQRRAKREQKRAS